MNKKIYLYNTLTKSKEKFVPVDPNHIRMYTCGPTVYNYAHIGNARPAVVSDLLVRLLRVLYPKVTYVSNITDIDDKIIKSSIDTGDSIEDITRKYEKIYNEDMASIGVASPDIQPRATEYIKEMINIVKEIIKNGKAYESDGHVLFDITKYSAYGKLSGRDFEDQLAGSRVSVADYKNNPGDFVLWKPSSEDQPGWNSPWGFGRPGWHLECSAMSEATLGLPFDIHAGGMDLIFPHHENEIAQSCGSCNEDKDPSIYSRYWLHNALLNMGGEKMSKSLGNILYIRDLIEKYNGEILRLTLLSSHYRQKLNWNEDVIMQSKKMLDKIYRVLNKTENLDIDINDKNKFIPEEFLDALCNDLNTSKALAVINNISKQLSKEVDVDKAKKLKLSLLSAGEIFGILKNDPKDWLGIKQSGNNINQSEIENLIEKRNLARKNKDFSSADKIRDDLSSMGIEIEDSSEGTTWKLK